jgi:hypothetical protein
MSTEKLEIYRCIKESDFFNAIKLRDTINDLMMTAFRNTPNIRGDELLKILKEVKR